MKVKNRFFLIACFAVGNVALLPVFAEKNVAKDAPATSAHSAETKSNKPSKKSDVKSTKPAGAGSAAQPAKKADDSAKTSQIDGAAVFKQYCASCHAGGGNSVKPTRPIAESAKLSNIGMFKEYLSAPPGHMPYYQSVVGSQKTVDALYKYCKGLKRQPVKQAYEVAPGVE